MADQLALFVAPAATPVAREIHCNGCAWGQVCEHRDACAHRIQPAEFDAACRNGIPSLEETRRGYELFACTPGLFEHFVNRLEAV